MNETRTIRDPFLGKNVEVSDRLLDRLRGKYAIGPMLPNGEPEFGWREFPTTPIQLEAAAEIERLLKDSARLDFLDEMNSKLNAWAGTVYRWKLIMNHNVNRLMLGHLQVDLNDAEPHAHASCRLAIDEEMDRILRDRAARARSTTGEG